MGQSFLLALLWAVILFGDATAKNLPAITNSADSSIMSLSNETKVTCEVMGTCVDCRVSGQCLMCTRQQMALSACQRTGYATSMVCPVANGTEGESVVSMQSCTPDRIVKPANFWYFETFNIFLFFVSAAVVWWRQKVLASLMYWKMQRQLGTCE